MMFNTLGGNSVPLYMAPYKVKWRGPTLSKFQSRVKKFFHENYSHLDWYEEIPLIGQDLGRMRWDMLCVFDDKWGKEQKVFVEVQGNGHVKMNGKFHKTLEDFHNQILRDELKVLFAAANSKFPVIEFFEDDPPLTLEWFQATYPGILPEKRS